MIADAPNSPADLLVPVERDGKLIVRPSRIKDVRAAREAFNRLKKGDEASARQRAKVQAMLDGEQPYDPAKQQDLGLAHMCNVNWGQGEQLLSLATAPYIDLLDSVDILCTTPTNFGEVQERAEIEQIIAEEITRMLRKWPEFYPRYLYLINQFLAVGVAIAFREDDIDWRWEVAPLGDFLIPRNTRASDDELEIGAFRRSAAPHELFAKISDEEIAAELGWNVQAVKSAILSARSASSAHSDAERWEDLQREFKNNDIGAGAAAYKTEAALVHMFVRELDGSISHMAFTEKPLGNDEDDFLYHRKGKFESASAFFTSFTYGVGTNGYFHSIRGLGHKIYHIVQALNRLHGKTFDGMMMASMQMIVPESEDALEDLSYTQFGPFVVMPPNVRMVEKTAPDLNRTLMPGLGGFNTLLQQQAGQYTTEATFNATRERTRYEVQAQLESLTNISVAALNLFYAPWERLLKETVRRITRPDYFPEDPGGRQVAEFIARCERRGVPREAIHMVDVDRVRVVKAIGNGSSAARFSIMRQLYELSANFDPEGQRHVMRDMTRSIGGVEAADRYTPAPENLRPPMEAKTAMLENNSLTLGLPVPVIPNELHAVHFPIHMQALENLIAAIDSGEQPFETAGPQLFPLHSHAAEHAQHMVADPNYPDIKQRMQQIDEIAWNLSKELEKLAREQQLAQGEGQANPDATAANPSGAPDTLQRQLIEATTKMRIAEETHAQKLRHKEQSFQQTQALKDAEFAAELLRKHRRPPQ